MPEQTCLGQGEALQAEAARASTDGKNESGDSQSPRFGGNNAAGRPGRIFSVRAKGLIVVCAVILYAIGLGFYSYDQKSQRRQQFLQIQASMEADGLIKDADVAAFYAMMAVIAHDAGSSGASLMPVHGQYMALRQRNAELAARIPRFKSILAESDVALAVAARDPSSANKNRLIGELAKVEQSYIAYVDQLARERNAKSQELRDEADSAAMTMMWFGILGLVLLAVVTGRFFKQLTADLRALQTRALDIVNGYRGEPIPIARHDEVGQLMAAVNSMADVLDAREKELMLERQKYFHQEKMAAVGTLAAGVAHEIGNPIAAIAGIAQEMSERCAGRAGCNSIECRQCRPDLIYAQTERLAAITREIADLASPQMAEAQWLDLNAQLRSTSNLIRYDRRLTGLELRLELDSQLPAIYGMADQLTQLIMNLLINAMDAMEGVQDRLAMIVVSTHLQEDRVCMTVEDNGHGIEESILSRVFDPFFTTKPAGKGTGLGLALCYSIVQSHGGSIDIESTPGVGTRVRVFFPGETERAEEDAV